MKKLLCTMLLVLSIAVPTANAIDAYRYHGAQNLVLEDSVDTFKEDISLRQLCRS